jgi:serine protease
VIKGIEWVTAHHVKPAVANMSLGGPVSQAVDDAVRASIRAGVTFVVAAGNENTSACNSSPARVPDAITVGSITSSDARSSFSNYGLCVSLFAPGTGITSTWIGSLRATNTISGTSMASPHVAGAAALYLAAHPQAAPAEVKAALVANGIQGRVTGAGSGSPDRLLNTQFLLGPGGGGGSIPDPQLRSGVPIMNLSGAWAEEKLFTIEVPANSQNLSIQTSGGTGDADIYVKFGAKPTLTNYDCRPFLFGNDESCSAPTPSAGAWYILIRGYGAYSGLTLQAHYQPGS